MTKSHDDVRNPSHWAGFALSGAIAFGIDAVITKLLTLWLGVPVLGARLVGILLSMIGGWLAHRRFTFALSTAPTFAEFIRYAGVAWSAAALNYAVFAVIIYTWPSLEPLIALFLSSLVAMVVAYLGMRFTAFQRRPEKIPGPGDH